MIKNDSSEKKHVFTFSSTGAAERLDLFLASQIADESRSSLKKLIRGKCVTVNNTIAKKSGIALQDGDVIQISFSPKDETSKALPQKVDLQIVDVQPDFIVINKAHGLLVHHAPSTPDEPSVVNGLLYHFKEFADFDDTERPGIVHRLDKDTSGLLLIGRNPVAVRELSALFKDREISKTYRAVVGGHPEKEGSIDFPIGRNITLRHKMSHVGFASRDAHTGYKVIEYYDKSALVECYPKTGRTHQIRVHLAAIGHGILGDKLYGRLSRLINRQALHAYKLSFEYKGKRYDYCAEPPADMQRFMKQQGKI